MKTIKVLLVEDLRIFRFAIKSYLSKRRDVKIVGEAENGREALAAVENLQPDVILMDVQMPVMDGIEAARLIRGKNPHVKIIMLTAHGGDANVFDAFAAGADGYVLKEDFMYSLELAIRTVRYGSVWLDPAIARRVLTVAGQSRGSANRSAAATCTLTQRETQVLGTIAEGPCQSGVCMVEPLFLERLRRFAS